jgi:hypothetical protein
MSQCIENTSLEGWVLDHTQAAFEASSFQSQGRDQK